MYILPSVAILSGKFIHLERLIKLENKGRNTESESSDRNLNHHFNLYQRQTVQVQKMA